MWGLGVCGGVFVRGLTSVGNSKPTLFSYPEGPWLLSATVVYTRSLSNHLEL